MCVGVCWHVCVFRENALSFVPKGFGIAYKHYLFVPIRVFGNVRLLRFLDWLVGSRGQAGLFKGKLVAGAVKIATVGGVYGDDGGCVNVVKHKVFTYLITLLPACLTHLMLDMWISKNKVMSL